MQNRYVGDIGDFGKYGLLRAIRGDEGGSSVLRLGVVWYLVSDESHTNDGAHVTYLLPGKGGGLDACDPELYLSLQRLVLIDGRSVEAVRRRRVLGKGTLFYEAPLVTRGLSKSDATAVRAHWVEQARLAVKPSDIVFLDPDNGIDAAASNTTSGKHVSLDEIAAFGELRQSVVVYHHLGRSGTHLKQMRRLATRITAETGRPVIALRARRGGGRAYFIIAAPLHEAVLLSRCQAFVAGPWGDLVFDREIVTVP